MANHWFRVWHDMPNDPKWRTVARVSGQPVSLVIAVFLNVLANASNAYERGRTQGLCSEDIASSLDVDTDQVDSVLSAMQGRVMDGCVVTGWSKRQPSREDGSAERAKAWRNKKKISENPKESGAERNRTQPNAEERPDTDTDTDTERAKSLKDIPADKTQAKRKRSIKTALPDGFVISDSVRAWAAEKGHHSLQQHFENFVGSAQANGYAYADWDAAFKNAIRSNWAKVPDKSAPISPASTQHRQQQPLSKRAQYLSETQQEIMGYGLAGEGNRNGNGSFELPVPGERARLRHDEGGPRRLVSGSH